MKIKMKRMLALLLCVATVFTLVSANVYAADYTITVKSNDGTKTVFTKTVPRSTVVSFTTNGFALSNGYDGYVYEEGATFLGFHTSSGQNVVSYAAGMTHILTGALTLYIVENEDAAHTIVGDGVQNATGYDLYMLGGQELTLHEDLPYYMLAQLKYYHSQTLETIKYEYFCINSDKPIGSGKSSGAVDVKEIYYFGSSLYGETTNYCFGKGNSFEEAIANCMASEKTRGSQVIVAEYGDGSNVNTNFDSVNSTVVRYCNVEHTLSSKKTPINPYYMPDQLMSTAASLRFDLQTLNLNSGTYRFAVKAKGEGYYDSDYSNVVEYTHAKRYAVTYNMTNASCVNIDGGNATDRVVTSHPLSVKVKPAEGYLQPDSVTVTMGGEVLTSGYTYYPETGNLVILQVTGDVVVTAEGIRKVATPVIEENYSAEDKSYPVVLNFTAVDNAAGYSVYVDGVKVSAVETTTSAGVVTMKIKAEVFPKSNVYNIYVMADPVEGYVGSGASNVIAATVSVQIATPVATARPDLRTEEYPFVCEVTKPANATALTCYMNGNLCGTVDYETNENGNWIVYFPTSVFEGSGDYEIYFVAHSGSTDFVESESSNCLTVTISKLATPVIWLE